jgi:hypothetical protein
MKIKLWSDIHLEFSNHKFEHLLTSDPANKEITLLLPGDIDVGMFGQVFIETVCEEFKHVLRTCGNHEFYGQDFESVIDGWRNYEETTAPKNFHFLNNDQRLIDGVRFLGGTMWTGFNYEDRMVMINARNNMNDYTHIMNGKFTISPEFILEEHNKYIKFLVEKLAEPYDGPTVVMSHHSPGNVLKRKGRAAQLLDYCYFADLEEFIGGNECIKLWVHGHTHQNYDYIVNETRVVCNPYGYHNYQTNGGFNKDLILEV